MTAGLLLLTSYVLSFVPAFWQRPGWETSRARRAARFVVRYAWVGFFVVAGCGLMAQSLGQWVRRF